MWPGQCPAAGECVSVQRALLGNLGRSGLSTQEASFLCVCLGRTVHRMALDSASERRSAGGCLGKSCLQEQHPRVCPAPMHTGTYGALLSESRVHTGGKENARKGSEISLGRERMGTLRFCFLLSNIFLSYPIRTHLRQPGLHSSMRLLKQGFEVLYAVF